MCKALCALVALALTLRVESLSLSLIEPWIRDSVEVLEPLASEGVMRFSYAHFRRLSVPYRLIDSPVEPATGLDEDLSIGNMIVYVPNNPVSEDLHLFFPGSWVACENYTDFLESAAASLYTICLPYDNRNSSAELCSGQPECFFDYRLKSLYGDFKGIRGNNQQNRLIRTLTWLASTDSESWTRFLTDDRTPRWDLVRVSGHSQGAGVAAMMGFSQNVSRVLQVSGPADADPWTIQLAPPVTSADRFFGLIHQDDMARVAAQIAFYAEGSVPLGQNCESLALTSDIPRVTASVSSGQVQCVKSSIVCSLPECQPETDCGHFGEGCSFQQITGHESVVMQLYWQDSNPYVPLWQALLGV